MSLSPSRPIHKKKATERFRNSKHADSESEEDESTWDPEIDGVMSDSDLPLSHQRPPLYNFFFGLFGWDKSETR